MNEGRADYVPIFLSDVPELFASGVLPLDAVLLNLTRPDAHGYCSFGTSVDATTCRDPSVDDGHRPAERLDAQDPRRLVHPR